MALDLAGGGAMIKRHFRFLIVATLALGAAAALVLLANAIFTTKDDLEAAAAAVATGTVTAVDEEKGGTRTRVGDALLGTGDDRDFLRALALFEMTRQTDPPLEVALANHAEAESILTRLAREGVDAERRSLAANMNGVLLFVDSTLDPRGVPRLQQLSLQSFQEAVRLDPENEEAKFNLEVLLRILNRQQEQAAREEGGEGVRSTGAEPEGSGF